MRNDVILLTSNFELKALFAIIIYRTHKSILILILLFWIIQPVQGQEADIVITGATLIDGTGAPPQDSTTILVQIGKIATVASDSRRRIR